jgi:hypothetical protein
LLVWGVGLFDPLPWFIQFIVSEEAVLIV